MKQRPYASRFVQCSLCPAKVTLNNFTTHLTNYHPERLGEPRAALYTETDYQPAPVYRSPKERPERIVKSKLPARVTPKPVLAEAPAPQLPPLGAEDIVTTVVEQLAEPGGMIPVAHLAAILTWHEATAVFLRSVSR